MSTAHADNRAAAVEHYKKGSRLYALGRFDEAVKEYEAAYEAKDDAALLYNIAQSYRLAGNAERAAFFYRSYLSHTPDASNRAEIEGRITELQHTAEAQAAEQKKSAEAKRLADDEAARQQRADEEQRRRAREAEVRAPAIAAPVPVQADTIGGHRKKIAGIGIGAAGLGLVIVGVALDGLAAKATKDLHNEATSGSAFDPSIESRGRTFNVVGPTLDAIGGAALITGIVLYVVGRREERDTHPSSRASVVLSPLAIGGAL